MTNAKQQIAEDELEISLNDIFDEIIGFFLTYWKFLLMGAISGALIVFGGILLIGKYEAEAIIQNGSAKISYSMWADLKKELPILAAQISEREKNSDSFLKVLSSEIWWRKNVTPIFAVSREDSKEVFGMPKEMQEAGAMLIKYFAVNVKEQSKEDALKNLSMATSFLRSGAAYLALENLIGTYQRTLLLSAPQIERDILSSKAQLAILNRHLANLELLRVKFPKDTGGLPVDLKDPSAKYLPLATQIIAVNHEIREQKEKLTVLDNKLSQIAIINSFMSQANLVMDNDFDGLSVIAKLEQLESGLRNGISNSDVNAISILNDVKYNLAEIKFNFTNELGQPSFISVSKPFPIKFIIIGLASGFFLALISSSCFAMWLSYNRRAQRRVLNQA